MVSYTHWLMLSIRWRKCVDYASPVSAWTKRMFEILNECNGDKLKATNQLRLEQLNVYTSSYMGN